MEGGIWAFLDYFRIAFREFFNIDSTLPATMYALPSLWYLGYVILLSRHNTWKTLEHTVTFGYCATVVMLHGQQFFSAEMSTRAWGYTVRNLVTISRGPALKMTSCLYMCQPWIVIYAVRCYSCGGYLYPDTKPSLSTRFFGGLSRNFCLKVA